MTDFDKLVEHFERFPGIGVRQAKRFAFHLLTESPEALGALAELIRNLHSTVHECTSCFRFYARGHTASAQCPLCRDSERDRTKLMVVERDSDVDAIERSHTYDGMYFVLGGTVPLLTSKDHKKLRGGAFKRIIEERIAGGLEEVILGFSVNPDGENTERYIESLLNEVRGQTAASIKVSHLGRGLSTGSELEYADPETIKNALKNRG